MLPSGGWHLRLAPQTEDHCGGHVRLSSSTAQANIIETRALKAQGAVYPADGVDNCICGATYLTCLDSKSYLPPAFQKLVTFRFLTHPAQPVCRGFEA